MEDHALVLVVDDDEDCRKVMCRLLESAGLATRAFASIDLLMTAFDEQEAGCLLLDLSFPQSNGLALQEWLRSVSPTTPVVYVSGSGNIPSAVQALKLGALDFLEKPVGRDELIAIVKTALREGARRRASGIETAEMRSRLATLTTRELEIARRLLEGLSSKEIATALGISRRTIDHHRSAVLHKMQASNVADLARKVAFAESGLA